MNKEQIQERLETTQRQIGILEQHIIKASKSENGMDPIIYNEMMGLYNFMLKYLKKEREDYVEQLTIYIASEKNSKKEK